MSIVTSTLILSPLLISPTPFPAVAVNVLERLEIRETSFLKNSYAAGPAVSGAEIVILSPAQNKLFSTPVSRFGSKSDFGFMVIIFESVLEHEIGSS